MRTYDSQNTNVIVDGVILTGFSEGSFVTAERLEDNFTEYVGAQGEVSISESNNKTGEITVTLESTSPSVPYLVKLANKKGEAAIVPISIVDLNTNSIQVSAGRARIRKLPTYETGPEIVEREFIFFCEKLEYK